MIKYVDSIIFHLLVKNKLIIIINIYVDVSSWLTIGIEERSQMRTGSIWHRPDEPLLVRQTHQATGQQKCNSEFHLF